MTPTPYHSSRARITKKIATAQHWLEVLQAGLEGQPHTIGAKGAKTMENYLEGLGFRVLTEARAQREGLRLRFGEQPIVRRKYAEPVGVVDLYCEEQFLLPGETAGLVKRG